MENKYQPFWFSEAIAAETQLNIKAARKPNSIRYMYSWRRLYGLMDSSST